MKYVVEGLGGSVLEAGMGESLGVGEYSVRIDGADHRLRILAAGANGMEFMLDDTYHKVRYVSRSTRTMSVIVDGVPVSLVMHAGLDKIVYKNSGGADSAAAAGGGMPLSLKSQIPGKVVSVAVSEGDLVRKGDVICTLESMKMQVAVKAHRDGTISSIRVKESATVAKGDVIADIG